MTLPSKPQIAKCANAMKLAEQCVRKVLKVDHEHQALLDIQTKSELEAVCVIMMRAHHKLWMKYEPEKK